MDQFTLNWPKLGNYGSAVIASTDAVYNTLYENYWYDKSKDRERFSPTLPSRPLSLRVHCAAGRSNL